MVSPEQFYEYCVARNLPFAFYRLPGAADVKIIAQSSPVLQKAVFDKKTVNRSGFVFAPFEEDADTESILIGPDVVCTDNTLPALEFAPTVKLKKYKRTWKANLKETSRAQFETLVKKIKKQIKAGNASKIIAARVIKKKKPKDFNPVELFYALCKSYPQAFVSLVFTSGYGLWVGASPEVLVAVNNNQLTTYALAGTKANTPENKKEGWGDKEKEEHAIVSRYIIKALQGVAKHEPVVKGPTAVTAGNLLHLRTTITYKPVAHAMWQKAVRALHPTPAVAGMPQKAATGFISRYEKNPRSFYSGYLGPVNLDGKIDIFVNLRCMRILKDKLAIYVGCGVTADSVPGDEWTESKIKSQTLLKVMDANK